MDKAAEEGLSVTRLCGERLNISHQRYYQITQEHPEIAELHQVYMARVEAYWEKKGDDNLLEDKDGPKFNTQYYKFKMSQRFKWRERHDVTTDNKTKTEVTVTIGGGARPDEEPPHED